jgi:hypothetical protein
VSGRERKSFESALITFAADDKEFGAWSPTGSQGAGAWVVRLVPAIRAARQAFPLSGTCGRRPLFLFATQQP